MPTPANAVFFATPVIWTPEQDEEHQREEFRLMLLRAQATADFVAGRLSPADFEEALFQGGIDPWAAHELWEEGFSCG